MNILTSSEKRKCVLCGTAKLSKEEQMHRNKVKKTKLLVAELRMMADSLRSSYCRDILIEAAQRLGDTDKIAQYYRNKAEGILNET